MGDHKKSCGGEENPVFEKNNGKLRNFQRNLNVKTQRA